MNDCIHAWPRPRPSIGAPSPALLAPCWDTLAARLRSNWLTEVRRGRGCYKKHWDDIRTSLKLWSMKFNKWWRTFEDHFCKSDLNFLDKSHCGGFNFLWSSPTIPPLLCEPADSMGILLLIAVMQVATVGLVSAGGLFSSIVLLHVNTVWVQFQRISAPVVRFHSHLTESSNHLLAVNSAFER